MASPKWNKRRAPPPGKEVVNIILQRHHPILWKGRSRTHCVNSFWTLIFCHGFIGDVQQLDNVCKGDLMFSLNKIDEIYGKHDLAYLRHTCYDDRCDHHDQDDELDYSQRIFPEKEEREV